MRDDTGATLEGTVCSRRGSLAHGRSRSVGLSVSIDRSYGNFGVLSAQAQLAPLVCESPDDVAFCSHYVMNPLHRHSPGFAVGIRRWLAEEDSAKMREQLRGERAVRKSVGAGGGTVDTGTTRAKLRAEGCSPCPAASYRLSRPLASIFDLTGRQAPRRSISADWHQAPCKSRGNLRSSRRQKSWRCCLYYRRQKEAMAVHCARPCTTGLITKRPEKSPRLTARGTQGTPARPSNTGARSDCGSAARRLPWIRCSDDDIAGVYEKTGAV